MVPEGWILYRCSEFIKKLNSGVSVNSEGRRKRHGECGILKTSCVSNGHFNPLENKAVTSESETLRLKEHVKKDTIIISRMNTPALVGANSYSSETIDDLFLPDRLWQVEKKSVKFSMRWLAYFFESIRTRYLLSSLATGTSGSMKNITKDDVLSLLVPTPPLPEQKKIARILSTWDKAIEKVDKLIENSKQQKKALMQQLLTGKKRLPGFSGEWREVRLGDVFIERSERGLINLPLLSITKDQGVIFRDGVGRKDSSSEDKSKYKRLCSGDIGYNTMRMWQGVSGISQYEGIVSPAYTIVTPTEQACSTYMAYLFKTPRVVHDFYRYSQGLTSDTWNLKFKHFKEVEVAIPYIEEQKAITNIIQLSEKKINKLQLQLKNLKNQKQTLMQQLLTGKRRVKVN